LNNRWWVHAGGTIGQLGATFCDRCARGGPAVRQDPYIAPWFGLQGDDRRVFVPNLFFNFWRGDVGHSQSVNLNGTVDIRVSSRFHPSLGFNVTHNLNDTQWFGNFTDSTGTTHYTFAHLDQKTVSLTGRIDYTLNTTLTVQLYAQPFVSKGTYSSVRQLAASRAVDYDARYAPYAFANPGGFNFKQFNSNLVVRWEYRPGSVLFVVWTQGRQDFLSAMGTRSFAGDFHDLFDTHPDNTFLVKASYWLSW